MIKHNIFRRLIGVCLSAALIMPSAAAFAADDEEEALWFKPGQEYAGGVDIPVREEVLTAQGGLVSYADTDELDTVGILSVLEIMGAYKDTGLFKPNVYISRAEFLEGLFKLLKIDVFDPNVAGEFYDVPKDHEYYGVVHTAVSYNIVSGYDNNTFKPDDVISYNDAVSMIVRALGYGTYAEAAGGYPMGYLNAANILGSFKNVSVNNRNALTRIEMARLLKEMLTAPMSKMTGESDGIKIEQGKTPLEDIYNIAEGKGVVEANMYAQLESVPADKNCLVIDGIKYYCDERYNNFLGHEVEFWYDIDDFTVSYMVWSDRTEQLVISADDIDGYKDGILTYYTENGRKKTADLRNAHMIYNGVKPDDRYDESIYSITEGTITLIKNNDKYYLAKLEEYENYVLNNVSLSNDELNFSFKEDAPTLRVDVSDVFVDVYNASGAKDSIYQKTESGEERTVVSMFKENNVISVYNPNGYKNGIAGSTLPSGKDGYLKIVISDKSVTGTVDMHSSGDFTAVIDGTEYDVSRSNYLGANFSKFNAYPSGKYLLDAFGKIVAVSSEADSGKFEYGYLFKAATDEYESDLVISIKLINAEGDIMSFKCTDKLIINGKKIKNNSYSQLKQSADMLHQNNPYIDTSAITVSQVIKYKAEDGVMKEIQTVTAPTGVAEGYDKDNQLRREERDGIGQQKFYRETDMGSRLADADNGARGLYFAPKVIFAVPKTDDANDKHYGVDNTIVGTFVGEAYDVTNLTPMVVVTYTDVVNDQPLKTSADAQRTIPVVFSDKVLTVNDDGEVVYQITVLNGWSNQIYECEKEAMEQLEKEIGTSLVKGQMIYLYGKNNIVTKITPLKWASGPSMVGECLTPEVVKNMQISQRITV
jgi:hypothetical protein